METKGKIYNEAVEKAEKAVVERGLSLSFGNQSIAARLLGINRNTLRSKIKKYSIDVGKFRI